MSDENSRREFLRWLAALPPAGLALGSFLGCGGDPGNVGRDAGSDRDAARDGGGGGDADAGALRDADAAGDASGDADGDTCETTGSDVEGPFHRNDAPERQKLAPDDEPGERLFLEGTVYEPDCTTPIEGALLDIWHADIDGDYDMDDEEYRLRGQVITDADGRYAIETVRPGNYPMSGTMRPAHIHFMVSKPGFEPLTTQMYFAGDPHLPPDDPCTGCNSDDPTLVIDLDQIEHDGDDAFEGRFDIVLASG